jgi:hypothetical protein
VPTIARLISKSLAGSGAAADAFPQQVRATRFHLAMVLRAKGNDAEA